MPSYTSLSPVAYDQNKQELSGITSHTEPTNTIEIYLAGHHTLGGNIAFDRLESRMRLLGG
jgi:hypothetical protein